MMVMMVMIRSRASVGLVWQRDLCDVRGRGGIPGWLRPPTAPATTASLQITQN